MSVIFWYEFKRLICNRIFLALLLISVLYSYMILNREIILGIAFTAPFSSWSFGSYLSGIMPLLMITLLFFITFMYSDHEKRVRQLTFAAPLDTVKLLLVKCASIIAAFLVIALFVIVLAFIFYAVLFGFTGFGNFIIPIVITVLPCLIFFLGAAFLLGKVQYNFLYVLMIAVLLLAFLPLPAFLDLYGGSFFGTYPLTLPIGPDGEPAFYLPASFILGRLFYCAAGALMAVFGIKGKRIEKC